MEKCAGFVLVQFVETRKGGIICSFLLSKPLQSIKKLSLNRKLICRSFWIYVVVMLFLFFQGAKKMVVGFPLILP